MPEEKKVKGHSAMLEMRWLLLVCDTWSKPFWNKVASMKTITSRF
jgi:hypothetical protein